MQRHTNGPDMQDCSTYLWDIQRSQNCHTTLLMELAGYEGGSHWRVHILSVSRRLVGTVPEWSAATHFVWPSRENKTFEGALYRALAGHDAEMSKQAFLELTKEAKPPPGAQ